MSGNIKNAILVLVMIAVGLGSGLMIIKPNIETTQSLNYEISDLQQRLAELQAKEADRAIYEAGIVRNKQEFMEILDKFPEDIQQENYIAFLGKMEEDKDIDEFTMNSLGFEEAESFYILGTGAVGVDGAQTDATATTQAATTDTTTTDATTTTENVAGTEGDVMNDSNMTGLKANVTVDYAGNYKGIKNMLGYIVGNDDRMNIDTMSLAYSKEEKKLTGSFSFNFYAISSESRKLAEPEVDGVDIGVDNIFNNADKSDSKVNKDISKNLDDGDKILEDYDYYVALNPSTSNADAVTIGSKSDTSAQISSNVNEVQTATVKFFKVGEKYHVSYNIGDVSYPEDFEQGVEFDPGDELNLVIKSSKRKNSKDKSGIKLVLDNETDMKLNVKIDGDDASNPRVKIASRIGKVQIYE